ncbi:MAG TPA: hypothetical protein VJT15_11370 [Pyrinomonadaceae bacterium]|nr:hypothetical protein [Pyrinomonadaceae bacterium]
MSDFLTNLVMRSFAQTPSVQPMTLSTYAAPEPQIETAPVEHVVDPIKQKTEVALLTRTTPVERAETVQNTDERGLMIEKAPLAEVLIPPQDHFTDPEPRQPEPTPKSVFPNVISKTDHTIAPAAQPAVQVKKTIEPLLVEQVVEHIVERPTVRTIEHSTTETIDRPSVTSLERTIEHSSITIENREHATNSFTTLVPKITPQSLPVRIPKARSAQRPVDLPSEQETAPPVTSPETVINVAIGRIEVRATPAPAQRRERQQGPKVMTLDDYAQQRSRGTQ